MTSKSEYILSKGVTNEDDCKRSPEEKDESYELAGSRARVKVRPDCQAEAVSPRTQGNAQMKLRGLQRLFSQCTVTETEL